VGTGNPATVSDRKIKPGTGNGTTGSACPLEAEPGRRDETTAVVTRMGRGSGGGFEGDAKAQAVSPLKWFWILRVVSMRWVWQSGPRS